MCKTMAIRMVVQVKETQPGIDRPQALRAIAQFKDYIILMYTAALLEHLRSSIDISFSLSFNSKKKEEKKRKRKKKKIPAITRRRPAQQCLYAICHVSLLHWPISTVGRPSSRKDNTRRASIKNDYQKLIARVGNPISL